MQKILFKLGLVDRGLSVKGARGDVVLQELLIHQVDYRGDELLEVFASAREGFDIVW